jgi:hypothetical protein
LARRRLFILASLSISGRSSECAGEDAKEVSSSSLLYRSSLDINDTNEAVDGLSN